MCQTTTAVPSGPESTRRDVLLAIIVVLAAGLGWGLALGAGFWVRGLIDRNASPPVGQGVALRELSQPAERLAAHEVRVAPQAGTEPLERADAAKPAAAAPGLAANDAQRPIVNDAQRPIVEAGPPSKPRIEAPPPVAAADPPPLTRQIEAVGKAAPLKLATTGFDLPVQTAPSSTPFILPERPQFALADLVLDEPAACSDTNRVCAVDRSLNTALTWAKSPAEAALAARKDGKLVFLIHVSGNFENPGFT
jgi:hypothetical protein